MILFVNKSCLIVVFVILCTGVVKLLAHIIGKERLLHHGVVLFCCEESNS